MKKIKIFMIAGEPSGDVLGSKLMLAIKYQAQKIGKDIEFIGVGGVNMEKQGLNSIFPISDLSLMGFVEILPHLPKLLSRIKQTVVSILESEVSMVITIDSPDFCFRVIKKLNQNSLAKNIRKVHLIAPTVWAYRAKRAKKIAKFYDLLLAILPFEPPYFEKYGLETLFIGHPITENISQVYNQEQKSVINDFLQKFSLKDNDLKILVMPGSRVGEVKRILPEIIGAINILMETNPQIVILLPIIKKTEQLVREKLALCKARVILLNEDEKYQAFAACHLAIAKSGTNNLEIALAQLPMITIYKINFITHFIVKLMVKIKFANLINLILGYQLIPELLQKQCCAKQIALSAQNLINQPKIAQNQVAESQNVLKILGLNSVENPSQKAAKKILTYF